MTKKTNDPGPPRKVALETVSDSPESLEATDIARKAVDVANAAITGTEANAAWDFPTDPIEAKFALSKYRAAISALNAANGIVRTKMQLFKLIGLDDKIKKLKIRGKKL